MTKRSPNRASNLAFKRQKRPGQRAWRRNKRSAGDYHADHWLKRLKAQEEGEKE